MNTLTITPTSPATRHRLLILLLLIGLTLCQTGCVCECLALKGLVAVTGIVATTVIAAHEYQEIEKTQLEIERLKREESFRNSRNQNSTSSGHPGH